MRNLAEDGLLCSYGDDHLGMGNLFYIKVKIANKKLEIESYNKRVLSRFSRYLSEFTLPDYVVSAAQSDIQSISQSVFGKEYDDFFQNDAVATDFDGIELLALLRNCACFLLSDNVLLFHAAAVAVKDKCFLFLAPSKTGKTTHALNWLKCIPGAYIVNGDKPFVNVETKLVFGTPWSGKENINKNTAVPLTGLVYLQRGVHNTIYPISFKNMIPLIIQETFIPVETELSLRAYSLINKLVDIPCYQLICNTNEDSALIAYSTLMGND